MREYSLMFDPGSHCGGHKARRHKPPCVTPCVSVYIGSDNDVLIVVDVLPAGGRGAKHR